MTAQDLTMTTLTDDFRTSLLLCAASISLVTARDETGGWHGMAVTSSGSLSMEPPSMMVAINRTASIHPVILRNGRFALNLMGEDRLDLLERFSRSDMRDQRFVPGEWTDAVGGVPALKDALSTHICSVVERHDFGTHTVFFGAVEDVILPRTDQATAPILWLNGARASVATPLTD